MVIAAARNETSVNALSTIGTPSSALAACFTHQLGPARRSTSPLSTTVLGMCGIGVPARNMSFRWTPKPTTPASSSRVLPAYSDLPTWMSATSMSVRRARGSSTSAPTMFSACSTSAP